MAFNFNYINNNKKMRQPFMVFLKVQAKHMHNPRQRLFIIIIFFYYKTEWNKTLKGFEKFRTQTPFFSIVPLSCCGYFSTPSVSSTLWLLITYPFKLRPPETHFPHFICAALFLPTSSCKKEQTVEAAGTFLPVAQHANTPPFSLQLMHYIAVSLTGGGVVLQWNQ